MLPLRLVNGSRHPSSLTQEANKHRTYLLDKLNYSKDET